MTATRYWLQLHTLPRPAPLQSLTRAIVYQGHPGIPVAQTAAYERNAGCGIAAAIKEGNALIDGFLASEYFTNVSSAAAVTIDAGNATTKESEPQMVKDYLSTYTTIMVAVGAIVVLVMKGCM